MSSGPEKSSLKSTKSSVKKTSVGKDEPNPATSVTAEPGKKLRKKSSKSLNAPGSPVPGVPLGLEYLLPLDHVFVKQQVELLEVIANIETANQYIILAGNGQRIYLASETTGMCSLCCGGPTRQFSIDICDISGRKVLHLERPCDCMLFCTTRFLICCGQIGGKVTVTLPDGTKYGEIVHKFNKCKPMYLIVDGAGTHLMTIDGPKCGDCCGVCCCNVDFPITSADGTQQIGAIRKSFSGLAQELFTDADNFGVEFPVDMDVKWKALMVAAIFLIDFMYFEKDQKKQSVAVSGGGTGIAASW